LSEAVSIEDYERAAELKKKIENLSKENNDAK
jgi:protein-arginine kinase activator protein McsA